MATAEKPRKKGTILTAVIGSTDNYKSFVDSMKEFLENEEGIYPYVEEESVYDWVLSNGYKNFEKDDDILSKFYNIVISYDDSSQSIVLQILTPGTRLNMLNRAPFANEIMAYAANLLINPSQWVITTDSIYNLNNIDNFHAKSLIDCDPVTPKDVSFEKVGMENVEGKFSTYKSIDGFTASRGIIDKSLDALADAYGVHENPEQALENIDNDIANAEEMSDKVKNTIRPMFDKFNMTFGDPTKLLPMIMSAASDSTLVRNKKLAKTYKSFSALHFKTGKPHNKYPSSTLIYTDTDMEFIKMTLEISGDIEEDVEYDVIDSNKDIADSMDDFFS